MSTSEQHLKRIQDKLQQLLREKSSAGVTNNFGEVQIGKGTKFNPKNLATVDYANVNPLGWTGEKKTDEQINTLLHNFNIKYNEELGRYKREKFNLCLQNTHHHLLRHPIHTLLLHCHWICTLEPSWLQF